MAKSQFPIGLGIKTNRELTLWAGKIPAHTRLYGSFAGETLGFVLRVHQVLDGENFVQLLGAQQAALKNDFADVLAGLGTDLADDIPLRGGR